MTQRAALQYPPTYGFVKPGLDAYLSQLQLRPLAREHGRYWSMHSYPTTVALPGNCYAKSLKGFTSHETETAFRELLREYADNGVPRPSSYADVFHERFQSPRVSYSVNACLAPAFAGGWQAAISVGAHLGTFHRYDMRSAYLWAASLGMPNERSYKRSERIQISGLYRVVLQDRELTAPFPFNSTTEVLASGYEIEMYNLRIREVISGVTWDGLSDPQLILKHIHAVSTWKQAARAFWGRWAQTSKIQCVTRNKKWFLPNVALNIPWAHAIVSRVRMRLWEFSKNAVHVFVDSVITRDRLPTGSNLGDWRLEKTYDNGVIIRAPGQYGEIGAERFEKMSGFPKSSTQRIIAI